MKNHLSNQVAVYRRSDPTNSLSQIQKHLQKRPLIPIGTSFDRRTVVANGLYIRNYRACRVRCTCGTESVIESVRLLKGSSKSCGCYRRDRLPFIPIGTQFDRWTVLANDLIHYKSGGGKVRACRVRCTCGTEAVAIYSSLKTGKSTSCGCKRSDREIFRDRYPPLPVGTQFGRWTVLANDEILYETKLRACRVRCTCGTESVVTSANLRNGISPSCGCKSKERSTERGWKELMGILKSRGREVHLTISQLKVLSLSNCSYCGIEPSNRLRLRYDSGPEGEIRYSGIDRVDSTKGYVPGNVVPCCIDCNLLKNDRTLDEFFAHIEQVRSHNPSASSVLQLAASLFDSSSQPSSL